MKKKLLFTPIFKWTFLLTLFIGASQAFAQAAAVNDTITNTYDRLYVVGDDSYIADTFSTLYDLTTFFGVTTEEFTTLFDAGEIVFGAIEPDGTFSTNYTANGYGHWLTNDGYVTNWGTNSYIYCEMFTDDEYSLNVGFHPDFYAIGDMYTTMVAFTYTPSGGGDVQRLVFKFNVTIVETLGIYDAPEVSSIKMWNKANHLFINKLPNNSEIKIYDILGKQLLDKKIQGNSFDVELSSGIKIIKINDNFAKKIVL